MASRNSTPTPTDVQKAEILLSESAAIMDTINAMANQLLNDLSPSIENKEIAFLADAITHLSAKAGWMTDLATSKLFDGLSYRGGAEDWLLSSRYHMLKTEVANG